MEAPLDFSHPVRFGQCSVCFEPPDTIVVVTAGRMDAETIDHVMKALVALAHGKPYVLHLMDISRLEGLSTDATAPIARPAICLESDCPAIGAAIPTSWQMSWSKEPIQRVPISTFYTKMAIFSS